MHRNSPRVLIVLQFLLQVRERLPTELPLHRELADPVPPFTREGPVLLPEAGQGERQRWGRGG